MNKQHVVIKSNFLEKVFRIIEAYKRGNQALFILEADVEDNQLRIVAKTLIEIEHDAKSCGTFLYYFWTLVLGRELKAYQKDIEKIIYKSGKLANQADLIAKNKDPFDVITLARAIEIYKRSLEILNENKTLVKLNRVKCELNQRENFSKEYNRAQSLFQKLYFSKALEGFKSAQKTYESQIVLEKIGDCESKLGLESAYIKKIEKSKNYLKYGFLEEALEVLKAARKDFPRQDSNVLINRVEKSLEGYNQICKGLTSEKLHNYEQAINSYNSSFKLLPSTSIVEELIYTRLSFSHFRLKDLNSALQYSEKSLTQPCVYLRGYIYFQQGEFIKASQSWKSSNHPEIKRQLNLLHKIADHQKLSLIRKIQIHVESQNLRAAKTESQSYLKKFGGDDYSVAANLEYHIQPCLEILNWNSDNISKVLPDLEKQIQQNFTLENVLNWAIASYFSAQEDKSYIPKMIASIFFVVTNLEKYKGLNSLPWLTEAAPNLSQLKQDLICLVQDTLDRIKDKDQSGYLQARDLYRVENYASKLNVEKKGSLPKVGNIYLTPGFYRYFPNTFTQVKLPQNLLSTLYTEWGTAVAACLDGDLKRAIKIYPRQSSTNNVEKLAIDTVTYYKGKQALQEGKWQISETYFKKIALLIQNSDELIKELDELLEKIRRGLDDGKDNIGFAIFWSSTTKSSSSLSYLVECKAEAVRTKIVNKRISLSDAKRELQELYSIDKNNILVEDLIEKIDFQEELEDLIRVMKNSSIETWVSKALRSKHQEIRRRTASVLMDILNDGIERRALSIEETKKIVRWLLQLSPEDPDIRYLALQLRIY